MDSNKQNSVCKPGIKMSAQPALGYTEQDRL